MCRWRRLRRGPVDTRSSRCTRRALRRQRCCHQLGPLHFFVPIARCSLAQFCCVTADLGPDLIDALRCALLTLRFVQDFLLLPQALEGLAPVAPCPVQARGNHEALTAFVFSCEVGSLGLIALGLDAITFGALGRGVERMRRRNSETSCREKSGDHRRQDIHVSEVSTSRRASARNSADCISDKRDTVRGNSCASGPSA